MNENMIYLSCDGDDCGKSVVQAILAGDEQAIAQASEKIEAGQSAIESWVLSNGGQKISSGGDESTYKLPADCATLLESLRKDFQFASGLTLTVGVGATIVEAHKALLAGKARGKNQVSQYEPIVEHEIQESHNGDSNAVAADGTPDPTATPLGEADAQYDHQHTDDCQYCEPSEGHSHTDDCKYCEASEAPGTHDHTDDCQYCQAAEAGDHSHTDDCKYCAAHNGKPENVHTDDCQYCIAMAQPTDHEHTDDCQYCANMGQQGQVSGSILANQVETDDPNTQTERGVVDAIDPSAMPLGDEMQDGVSRPDGYDGQLAEGEDEQPNMGDVLQSNLDQHGDQIAKEKIVGMVGEALEGFKANKQILEKAKEQAPELYQSTIKMLRAMIEMCKMLGLKGEEQAPSPQQSENPEPQEGSGEAPKVPNQAASS